MMSTGQIMRGSLEYAVTRVRAKRSIFLKSKDLKRLTEASSVRQFILLLQQTPYRHVAQQILASSDVEGQRISGVVANRLQNDFVETFAALESFVSRHVGATHLMAAVRGLFDAHNLSVVMRHVIEVADETLSQPALLPIGTLQRTDLEKLLAQESMASVIDELVTWRHPFRQHLLPLRNSEWNAVMRLQVEGKLYRGAWHNLLDAATDARNPVLYEHLRLQCDLQDAETALNVVHQRRQRQEVELVKTSGTEIDWLACGRYRVTLLEQAAASTSLATAAALLLKARPQLFGFDQQHRASTMPSIENYVAALEAMRLYSSQRLFVTDGLGIGAFWAYIVKKRVEIRNLRLIAYGLEFGLGRQEIGDAIIYPTQ